MRQLGEVFDYASWNKFKNVISRAMLACKNSGYEVDDHFSQTEKMVEIGSGAKKRITDYFLTRYACYLIIQNATSSKLIIALGQTYFAVQTRRQEISESLEQLEEKKRLLLRNEMKKHNISLAEAAKSAGVVESIDYAIFQNFGYKGLYGGLDNKKIREKKGLNEKQQILDHMGSTELAANLFRATQTDEKLRREKIQGKQKANNVHYDIGKKVRETIKDIGGTMPEELPTPDKSIKAIEKETKKCN